MTYRIRVSGLVQGIGFRPFVTELAELLQLSGQVKNLGGIVELIVSGDMQAVDAFVQRLRSIEESGELPGCRIDENHFRMDLYCEFYFSNFKNHFDSFDSIFPQIEKRFVSKKSNHFRHLFVIILIYFFSHKI